MHHSTTAQHPPPIPNHCHHLCLILLPVFASTARGCASHTCTHHSFRYPQLVRQPTMTTFHHHAPLRVLVTATLVVAILASSAVQGSAANTTPKATIPGSCLMAASTLCASTDTNALRCLRKLVHARDARVPSNCMEALMVSQVTSARTQRGGTPQRAQRLARLLNENSGPTCSCTAQQVVAQNSCSAQAGTANGGAQCNDANSKLAPPTCCRLCAGRFVAWLLRLLLLLLAWELGACTRPPPSHSSTVHLQTMVVATVGCCACSGPRTYTVGDAAIRFNQGTGATENCSNVCCKAANGGRACCKGERSPPPPRPCARVRCSSDSPQGGHEPLTCSRHSLVDCCSI